MIDFRQNEIHAQLMRDLAKSVIDPDHWQTTLKSLCQYCGASKALITRRTFSGAEIVIPKQVEEAWKSPLIYGFSEQDVGQYLEKYARTDPWTEIEAQIHPYRPYAFSKYLPEHQLKSTRFWEWLEPQRIVDCVVVELEHDKTGWSALNLYLNVSQAAQVSNVVAALEQVRLDVTSFWSLSRDVFRAQLQDQPWSDLIAGVSEPVILTDADFKVTYKNRSAIALQATGLVLCDIGQILGMPISYQKHLGISEDLRDCAETHPELHLWQPSIPWRQLEEYSSGERFGQQAFMFHSLQAAAFPWDHPALNEREKLLVRHIANGGKVQDGAQIFGISVRANADIWRSAREKLGNPKKQDLQARLTRLTKDEET